MKHGATVTCEATERDSKHAPGLGWRCAEVDCAGVSLVGMLVSLIILGILAYVAVNFLVSPSATVPVVTGTSTAPSATPTTGQPLSSVLHLAVVTACRADFTSVETAISDYRAVSGANPPSGTAWATATLSGGPFLQSWPTGNGAYAIGWNGANVVVTPRSGVASVGNVGTPTPPTGCYAVH